MKPAKPSNPPPSHFSAAGVPYCSMWGKTEIEILAWAYVTGLARDGNTWHTITPERCHQLLDEAEQRFVHPFLPLCGSRYESWWKLIETQLKDSEGAYKVGGLSWSRWNIDPAKRK